MYLSKDSLISLFFQMSHLYSEKNFRKQGRIQFVSIMKYFLAMDEFAKAYSHPCDTKNREDKRNFIACVADVVRLSDTQETVPFYTKDFFSEYGSSKDYNVGSNFFSTNSVSASALSSDPICFPLKYPALLECNNSSIHVVNEAYDRFANDENYLAGDCSKYALLFIWLNRFTIVSNESSAYTEFLMHLKELYSQSVIDSLRWESEDVKKKIDEFLAILNFDESPTSLKHNDLILDELSESQIKKAFSTYLVVHCTAQRPEFKPHCIDVCESWLDRRLPNNNIGNLFRFKNTAEYKKEYDRIRKINEFEQLNENDQSGRTVTALNHYRDFLEFVPHKEDCSPWQQDLEDFAHERNIQLVVDSTGDRVIVFNGCVIALDDNVLFACIYNDKFNSYRENIEPALNAKGKWFLCRAEETIPKKPYNSVKTKEIIDSEDDKCLYTELTNGSVFKNDIAELIDLLTEQDTSQQPPSDSTFQTIYYGVPGCGKSHEVNKKLKSIPDYNKVRTVFHPEYTNADFIGQILPEVNINTEGYSVIEYKFKPGPFTEIIRRAYHNPDENFYLVIEEINRGNAAAIFGDMFQLLDRLDADEKTTEVSSEHIYGKHWSSYGVDNPDINAYIRNHLVISSEKPGHCSKVDGSGDDADPRLYKSIDIESEKMTVTWREKNGNGFTPKPNHLHFSANTAIRLPPNVSIYATMNTSDQNVFTLDNAFQRRWDMELIPNTCNWNDADHKNQAQLPIGDTDIRWETFRGVVNAEISGGDFFNADDKQLGMFFIEANGEKIDEKKFANKVLKYLRTDVFKRNTDKIFKVKDLSKIVEDFTGEDAFDKVFVKTFVQTLKSANDEIKNK